MCSSLFDSNTLLYILEHNKLTVKIVLLEKLLNVKCVAKSTTFIFRRISENVQQSNSLKHHTVLCAQYARHN